MDYKKKLALALLAASLLGLYAAFGLMLDKLALLQNKQLIIPCNINPILSCIQVMQTPYASMFGFPNPLLGLMGYAAMATLAVVMFLEGAGKYVMRLALIGGGVAAFYSYALLTISMFLINALCPLCLLSAFASTIILFITLYLNLKEGNLGKRLAASKFVSGLLRPRNYLIMVASWFAIVVLAMYLRFPTIFIF